MWILFCLRIKPQKPTWLDLLLNAITLALALDSLQKSITSRVCPELDKMLQTRLSWFSLQLKEQKQMTLKLLLHCTSVDCRLNDKSAMKGTNGIEQRTDNRIDWNSWLYWLPVFSKLPVAMIGEPVRPGQRCTRWIVPLTQTTIPRLNPNQNLVRDFDPQDRSREKDSL